MLYREIIAVCSQIHTKHINTLCGLNVEFLNLKPDGTKRFVTKKLSTKLFVPVFKNMSLHQISWLCN